nr:hypothetical protein [Tanacetum cinerariifolium]
MGLKENDTWDRGQGKIGKVGYGYCWSLLGLWGFGRKDPWGLGRLSSGFSKLNTLCLWLQKKGERVKKKWLKLEHGSAKRMKILDDVFEEDIKEMMQLVPVKEVYVEALQVKHPIIDWEIHSEGQRDY